MGVHCTNCGGDLVEAEHGLYRCGVCQLAHLLEAVPDEAETGGAQVWPATVKWPGGDYACSQGAGNGDNPDRNGVHGSSHRSRPLRTWNGTGVTPVSQCGVEGCNGDHDATTEWMDGQEPPCGVDAQRFPKPSADGGDAQELANALRCWYTRPRPPRGGTPRGPSISNMHGSTDSTQKIEPGEDVPIPYRHRWLGVPAPCRHTWVREELCGAYSGDICTQCGERYPIEKPFGPPTSRSSA